jgi:hypothetical protein
VPRRTYTDDADQIRSNVVVDAGGCWIWQLACIDKGYGRITVRKRIYSAHRFSYTTFVGPIPEGLTIDHLCGVRPCVNPDHLEPVSQRVNNLRSPHTLNSQNARKTHCPQGHPYDAANTYIIPSTRGRMCRTCMAAKNRRRAASASAA